MQQNLLFSSALNSVTAVKWRQKEGLILELDYLEKWSCFIWSTCIGHSFPGGLSVLIYKCRTAKLLGISQQGWQCGTLQCFIRRLPLARWGNLMIVLLDIEWPKELGQWGSGQWTGESMWCMTVKGQGFLHKFV